MLAGLGLALRAWPGRSSSIGATDPAVSGSSSQLPTISTRTAQNLQ